MQHLRINDCFENPWIDFLPQVPTYQTPEGLTDTPIYADNRQNDSAIAPLVTHVQVGSNRFKPRIRRKMPVS